MSIASNLSSLVSATNVVVVSATTQSVSTSSGALIVRGGAGIAGNIYGGGSAIFAGTLTARTLTISTTTDSISTLTGALIVRGGVGIGGSLFVGGVITATNFFAGTLKIDAGSTMTNLVITGTNVSISTTTGALQVAGGVGIGGDIYFGGNLYQNGVLFTGGGGGGGVSSTGTTSTFTIGDTTTSVSSTTGALQVLGGVGVVGDLNVGGSIYDSGQRISPLRNLSLYQSGTLLQSVGSVKWFAPFNIKIVSMYAKTGTAPGAALIVTLKSNGSGVLDVTVPGAGTTSPTANPVSLIVNQGSYLTIDVAPTDNNAAAGSELYVIIVYQLV